MKTTERHFAGLTTLLKPVAEELERVRSRMVQVLAASSNPAGDCISQLDLTGGKMLRPALTLLSGRCFGPLGEDHRDLAAMMEMVHLASLMHDDVIDRAETRRGRRSANALWGNTQAVLLGDYVLSRAFAMGAALRVPGAAAVLCQTAETICIGEIRQNRRKGDWTLTEAEYLTVIEEKTASLFGACCALGALAGQAEPAAQDALRKYGLAFGMAFQITDDLLDIVGSAEREGKTLGADLLNEKLTLPIICWLQQGGDEQAQTRRQWICTADRAEIGRAIQDSGAVVYARRRAQDFARAAEAALEYIPDSDARQAMFKLTAFVLERTAG